MGFGNGRVFPSVEGQSSLTTLCLFRVQTSEVVILAHHSSITLTQKKLAFLPALSALCTTVQATLPQTHWELSSVCQQLPHMTFVKSFLSPETTLLYPKAPMHPLLELLAAPLCVWADLCRGDRSALLPQESALEKGKKRVCPLPVASRCSCKKYVGLQTLSCH